MLRIILLLATNFAVLLLASIVLSLLGVGPWLDAHGINFGPLLIVGALIGFGGAFFSLAISKWIAKRTLGVQVITTPQNETEAWLVATVTREATAAGIRTPEIGIFESPEPNAFATGARRDASLVAVSTGLLARMGRPQAEAVLGHEVTHVANGDMVTLTLIQGVVNTFVFVLSRVIGNLVDKFILRNDGENRGPGIGFFVSTLVAQVFLSFLASMIVMWFSRRREFRADAGGARLGSRDGMIGALETLKRVQNEGLPEQLQAFGIAGPDRVSGLKKLFMSHPPLDERIQALRQGV
jgi:heat shock protein HtpX